MHYPIVCYVQGQILKIEGALLLVPALTGLLYREPAAAAYLLIALMCEAIGLLLTLRRPKKFVLYAREGMVSVALAWIVLPLFCAEIFRPFPMHCLKLFPALRRREPAFWRMWRSCRMQA